MAFVGTMFLGWIAYKQNDDLKNIEESNFIANNSCIDLLRAVSLYNKRFIDPDEYFNEQIVIQDKVESSNQGFYIKFVMDRMTNISAYVHVSNIMMFFTSGKGKERNSTCFLANAKDECYSAVAISKNRDFFSLTVLMKPETKLKFLEYLQKTGALTLEIEMELVSPNYVKTKMKNRATFSNTNKIDKINFKLIDAKPLSFWRGSEITSKKKLMLTRKPKTDERCNNI